MQINFDVIIIIINPINKYNICFYHWHNKNVRTITMTKTVVIECGHDIVASTSRLRGEEICGGGEGGRKKEH